MSFNYPMSGGLPPPRGSASFGVALKQLAELADSLTRLGQIERRAVCAALLVVMESIGEDRTADRIENIPSVGRV